MKNTKLEFKYHRINQQKKTTIIKLLKTILKADEEVVFAYLHGGFIEAPAFRDIDIAVWLKNPQPPPP